MSCQLTFDDMLKVGNGGCAAGNYSAVFARCSLPTVNLMFST